MLAVTPADVAAYAPDMPAVTELQLGQAQDWAAAQLESLGIAIPAASRQERELMRAISAYALAVRLGLVTTLTTLQGAERVVKLKDGAEEITFAGADVDALRTLPLDWLQKAWLHLYAAGLPKPRRSFFGASR